MRNAKFKVFGNFGKPSQASITINRNANLISVRPHKWRKTFELPLASIAEYIVWTVIKKEIAEKKKQKKNARRNRLYG